VIFFFQAEDGIRDRNVTGVQTCALPIYSWCACPMWGILTGSEARRWESRTAKLTAAGKVVHRNYARHFGRLGGSEIGNRKGEFRSEERRVGKECRTRRGRDD